MCKVKSLLQIILGGYFIFLKKFRQQHSDVSAVENKIIMILISFWKY